MKIINQNYEETVYRLDVLGDIVSFVDWTKNTITINPGCFKELVVVK